MLSFPTRVLVGIDRSDAARAALEAAADLCRATTSELHLVHVKSTSSTVKGRPVTPEQGHRMEAEAASLLAEAADVAQARGTEVAATHVRFGERVERALTRAQRELDAGLLVVGSERSGSVARSLLGGGATGTVARSGGSVLVVRGPAGARAEG
jgi:nucleotide-binding universal stress UspA family protein